MANNKIIYNGTTLIDLTQDTVTAADVRAGKIFHLPSGVPVYGSLSKPIITDARYLFYASSRNRLDQHIKIQSSSLDHMFYQNSFGTGGNDWIQSIFQNQDNQFNAAGSLESMFDGCADVTSFDLDYLNINSANGIILKNMFSQASSLASINIGSNNILTSDCSGMFVQSRLSSCDVSKLKAHAPSSWMTATAANLLRNNFYLTTVTFENLANSFNFNDISYLFYNCGRLTSLNNIDIALGGDITNAAYAFSGCTSLNTIKLSNFKLKDGGNQNSTSNMFRGCSNLTTIDLLWENGDDINTTANMFYGCTSLQNLIIRWTGGVAALTSPNSIATMKSDCNIYVPDDLVDSYKSATNWVTRAAYIRPLSEYVEE